MLKSYEAKIENGQIKWLTDEPKASSARVTITVVEDTTLISKRRVPPASIAEKSITLRDIVNLIVSEKDWECLK